MEIVRLESPTVEEYFAASEVSALHWPYLRSLYHRARFEALQRLGVELVVARQDGRFEASCFVLPCAFEFGGETLRWVCPFHLATRPESRGSGGLLFLKITRAYPVIVSLGVTREAMPFYAALGWKRHDDVWRGVHPVRMDLMAEDFGQRLPHAWQRSAVRAMAGVYNAASGLAEGGLALLVRAKGEGTESLPTREKEAVMRSYLEVLSAGPRLRCANVGGFGRVLNSFHEGMGEIPDHARVWGELRRRGARFCEVLIGSHRSRRRAMRLGYLPMRMPLFYRDGDGTVAKFIRALERDEVSFLHTDKSV